MEELYPYPKDTGSMLPASIGAQHQLLVKTLAGIPSVRLYDSYTGSLRAGKRSARLRIESEDWIGVRMPLETDVASFPSAGAERELPSNLRVGDVKGKPVLIAETRVDGVAHLVESIGEIRDGLRVVLAVRPPRRPEPPDAPEAKGVAAAVEAARQELELDETEAVELEDDGSFELHLRPGGQPVVVRITRERGGVRLAHAISRTSCEGTHREALEAEVQRRNARIRFARIVFATDGGLFVESRLRSALVTGEWIALTARAIATVTREVQAPLRLLAADPRVAEAYAAVLQSRLEPTT